VLKKVFSCCKIYVNTFDEGEDDMIRKHRILAVAVVVSILAQIGVVSNVCAITPSRYTSYQMNEVFAPQFQLDQVFPFYNGYSVVVKNGKYGVVDKHFQMVIPFTYDFIEESLGKTIDYQNFSKFGQKNEKGEMRYGFLNKENQVLISPVYESVTAFQRKSLPPHMSEVAVVKPFELEKDRYIAIVKTGEKFGMINGKGEILIPVQYEGVFYENSTLVSYKQNEKFGFYNSDGKKLTDARYDEVKISDSRPGYYVRVGNLWGFFDEEGYVDLIPAQYDDIGRFTSYNNKTFERVILKKGGQYWVSDSKLNLTAISKDYQYIGQYRDGLAAFVKNGKMGFMNEFMKEVIEPLYDGDVLATTFFNRRVVVKKNGKYGVVDTTGNEKVPFLYDWISNPEEYDWSQGAYGYQYCFKKDQKYGFFSEDKGKEWTPNLFDEVYFEQEQIGTKTKDSFIVGEMPNERIIVKQNGKWGAIDERGLMSIPFENEQVLPDGKTIKDGKEGYGSTVRFDQVNHLGFGFYLVKDQGKYGFYRGASFTKAPTYDDVIIGSTYYWLKKDGKYGVGELYLQDDPAEKVTNKNFNKLEWGYDGTNLNVSGAVYGDFKQFLNQTVSFHVYDGNSNQLLKTQSTVLDTYTSKKEGFDQIVVRFDIDESIPVAYAKKYWCQTLLQDSVVSSVYVEPQISAKPTATPNKKTTGTDPTNAATASPTTTPPVSTNEHKETPKNEVGLITLRSELDKVNGEVRSSVSMDDIKNAINEVSKNAQGEKIVTLVVGKIEGAKKYTQELPLLLISDQKNAYQIKIQTEFGTLLLSSDLLLGVDSKEFAGAKDITLSITKKDVQKSHQQLGVKALIDVALQANGKSIAWKEKSKKVNIRIPYQASNNELLKEQHLGAVYMNEQGDMILLPSGRYDKERQEVSLWTNHFSEFGVSFVEKTFDDMAKYEWAKNQIEVLASKGIITGISKDQFGPGKDISRADFTILLVKTLGLEADVEENFSDVDVGSYYYHAVGVAKKLGIANGVTKTEFNPKGKITRQDMMVLIKKALVATGKLDQEGTKDDISVYLDQKEIDDYALNSVATMVKEGLVVGNNQYIYPKGFTTRAEMAALIYRLYWKM
jgi:hypothetical protein